MGIVKEENILKVSEGKKQRGRERGREEGIGSKRREVCLKVLSILQEISMMK